MFPDKTVLAVDGGASKADVALVDVKGNLIGAARRRGSYHFGLGYNGSLDALTEAIKAIRRRGNTDSSQAIAARYGPSARVGRVRPSSAMTHLPSFVRGATASGGSPSCAARA